MWPVLLLVGWMPFCSGTSACFVAKLNVHTCRRPRGCVEIEGGVESTRSSPCTHVISFEIDCSYFNVYVVLVLVHSVTLGSAWN